MNEIKGELERIVRLIFGVDTEVEVEVASGQKMADGREVEYASNVAMRLAREVGKSPREIADEILRSFELEMFEGEVAGPGFLNFIASDGYYLGKLAGLVDDFEKNISCSEYSGKTVICEFSDPNPFKVLHVGHLYTSVVGDAISRLFEYAGARVVRANFGGDVGLHVAKTLYALTTDSEHDLMVTLGAPEATSVAEATARSVTTPSAVAELLARYYVLGTRLYEEDDRAREEITKLNREIYRINRDDLHDTELSQLYWWGREQSYAYFKEFYARLSIEFDKYYPESAVAELGVKTVREHPKVYVRSDGATVFRGEEDGLHTRVFINKEGLPTYEAKDVGLLCTKWKDFGFDKSVVITGNEQKDYMAVVLKSVERYAPELTERSVHLTHGMVRLPGNVKMSSRLGNFLRAVDTIEMVREELGSSDERLLMAALKYAFLKYKMGGDIEFDAKSSVAVTGNSGIYLEYAVVRAKKILEKLRGAGAEDSVLDTGYRLEARERSLIRKICEYGEVLAEAVAEMAPYKICAYLYELAQEFSRFYEGVKVVGSEHEVERGRIVKVYLAVLEHGLDLLGIKTVEEM